MKWWIILFCLISAICDGQEARLRLIVETDAGGDPDDEQSLVRFLVYASEFDIEGIIANRPVARDGENKNPVRAGHRFSNCSASMFMAGCQRAGPAA